MFFFATALAWTPTPAEQDLVRALSMRDHAPPCADLAERVPDAVASLSAVVEHVSMPPWAPMRAAVCLIEHYEEAAEPLMLSWVVDPQKLGLAKLVFRRTHLLAIGRSTRIQSAALAGPLAETARRVSLPH